VKDYVNLTPTGKLRRVGRLARSALGQYEIDVAVIRMHCFATNLLYRVQAESGERFILRMAYPGWRTIEDLRAEAAWLEALDRDTDIGAPKVVRAANGDTVLPMRGAGVPDTWHATLMTWVDGRLLAHHLTCANLEEMGNLFARLHIHAKSWKPPLGFTTRRFEAFLSRGEPDAVFSDAVTRTFGERDREAFLRARGWVRSEYARLDRDDIRVIHCDLWHENVKLDHGRLRPFDFEDTVWGYRAHDIAMGMLDLLETVGAAEYGDLLAAFRLGYERLLDWPEGNVEVLQIGRLLWKANYIARFARQSLGPMVEEYGRIFRSYEQTGELRLPD
jgi:Ser/Thr protein kinase RdoA (MazF antagonist)